MSQRGTGVLVGALDAREGLVDAPARGRSLFQKLSCRFNREDERASLENLREWSSAQLEYWIEQRRHKLYELLDRFPEADANESHRQFQRIQSVLSQIRRTEQVLGERAMEPSVRPSGLKIIPQTRTIEEDKAERKAERDRYKAECKAADVRLTNEMIGKAAFPETKDGKTIVQKWLRCDPRYNGEVDRRIRKVFAEKPHLPKQKPHIAG